MTVPLCEQMIGRSVAIVLTGYVALVNLQCEYRWAYVLFSFGTGFNAAIRWINKFAFRHSAVQVWGV